METDSRDLLTKLREKMSPRERDALDLAFKYPIIDWWIKADQSDPLKVAICIITGPKD